MDGKNAETVHATAKRLFRCIDFSTLTKEMMATNKPDPELYKLSRPARLGEVDCFLSHSWSDDPESKWAAMVAWRDEFHKVFGREPTLWIDKFCIDQTNIADNLRCLPVFLSGCTYLVVAC